MSSGKILRLKLPQNQVAEKNTTTGFKHNQNQREKIACSWGGLYTARIEQNWQKAVHRPS